MVIAFFVLFVLILIAVSVGLKFFDARRKKQVGKMLQTAAGEPVVTVTNLLKELSAGERLGPPRGAGAIQIHQARAAADPTGRHELVAHTHAFRYVPRGHSGTWNRRHGALHTERAPHGDLTRGRIRIRAIPLCTPQTQTAARPAGRTVPGIARLSGAFHARRPRVLDQPGDAGRRNGRSAGPGIPRSVQRTEPRRAARHGAAQFRRSRAAARRPVLYVLGAAAEADRRQLE